MTRSTLPFNLHPKVAIPASALAVIGVVLIAIGFITAQKEIQDAGYAVVGASGVNLGLGYQAPTADSEAVIGPPSDAGLTDEAKSALTQQP